MSGLPSQLVPTTVVALARYPGLAQPTVIVEVVGRVVAERVGYVFHDVLLEDWTERIWIRHVCGSHWPEA